MSAASGSQAKGEANKKFKSLNINNIFKGKSIEPTTKTVIAKHGMQSLGKVASVRRIPPPANLPSLKAENCGNDPNVNLVPAGGQGWGNKAEETASGAQNAVDSTAPLTESPGSESRVPQNVDVVNQVQAIQGANSNSSSIPTAIDSKSNTMNNSSGSQSSSVNSASTNNNVTSNSNNVINNSKAAVKGEKSAALSVSSSGITPQITTQKSAVAVAPTMPWNSGAGSMGPPPIQTPPLDGGPQQASSVQQSPFFHREFPTLGGGSSLVEPTPQYGPGPSLRPETKGSWVMGGGRGVVQPQQDDRAFPSPHNSAGFNGEMAHANRSGNLGPRGSPPVGMSIGPSAGGAGMGCLPGPPGNMPGYLGPMGPPGPHQFRGMMTPYMRGGGNMPRPPGYLPSGRPPFPRDTRYRGTGPHPDEDNVAVPPPIIKKEDLEDFEPAPSESDGWANSAADVDYNKKLNFSEDEASTEEERNTWRNDRGKDKKELERNSSKTPDSTTAFESNREKDDRKLHDDKRERLGSHSEVPPRWQQQQQQQQPSSTQPLRSGFDQNQRDYNRRSSSPAASYEDDGWKEKRRESEEVKAALERARHLQQEEEKRYEEKKRFDQSKSTGIKRRDGYSESSETDATADQQPFFNSRDRENRSGSSCQDGGSREREGGWDAIPESSHEKGKDYKSYGGDRRDVSHRENYRDQYDNSRPYDRRDQQPMFSSAFKSKLPPRFQKQQQQEMQRGAGGGGGGGPPPLYRVPPQQQQQQQQQPVPLFEPRFNQPRHLNRDDSSKPRRTGLESDAVTDDSEERPSNATWASNSGTSWSNSEREEQWNVQQPYSERTDRPDGRPREDYSENKERDNQGHYWGSYNEKERDTRSRTSLEKHEYELNRKRTEDRNWDDKLNKRFDNRNRSETHHEWTESDAKSDWRHEHNRPSADEKSSSTVDAASRRGGYKEWDKEEEPRERPQRPDSRDSRGSRESRTSRDSVGSFQQREKKIEVTSWADSTSEFDDYYRSDIREDHNREASLLKDLKIHDPTPPPLQQESSEVTTLNNEALVYEESFSSEPQKDHFRSGMAPAPITKERLEASESGKEVRKNMTTLRRNQNPQEPPRRNIQRESIQPHEGRQNNSAWSNSRPKNGDRSRPDSSGTTVPVLSNSSNNNSNNNRNSSNDINSTNTQHSGNLPREKGMTSGASSNSTSTISNNSSTNTSHNSNNTQTANIKKEPENVWNQQLKNEKLPLSMEASQVSKAAITQATSVATLTATTAPTSTKTEATEEGNSVEKGQGAAGSKNLLEENLCQVPNKIPQQNQKSSLPNKDETIHKKVVSGGAQTTPVQRSLLTVNAGTDVSSNNNSSSNNNNEFKGDRAAKDNKNGGKSSGGSQRGGRSGGGGGSNRYDAASNRGGRGGGSGGGRVSGGSYSLYRGRGAGGGGGGGGGSGRGNDYRRGGSARVGHPPRFQNRGYRQDDYYYYDYPPQRKDLGQDQNRYGSSNAGWGRNDMRRGRNQSGNQTGRTGNISEVPSLMDADIRKQPNNRYERMPPRFQKKREQEQQYASNKRDRNVSGTHQGGSSNDKGNSNFLMHSTGKTKENTPEGTEDADWETASENSDPDRIKDGKDKRERKYNRQDNKKPLAGGMTGWQNNANISNKNNSNNMANKENKIHGGGKPFDNRKMHTMKQEKSKTFPNLKSSKSNDSNVTDGHDMKGSLSNVLLQNSDKNRIKQEKNNTLEGIDLNNFASVVIVDNQPQVSELMDDLLDGDAGFQEVTRKKGGREKHRTPDDRGNGSVSPSAQDGNCMVTHAGLNKKQKDKKKNKNSGYEKSRQKLPPRFAKKRENKGKGDNADIHSGPFFQETNIAPPPTKNAWEKPLTASLRTNSPQQTIVQEIISSNIEIGQESHDSGVEVSDPPNSTGSSQRSSPSDNPVFARQDKGLSNMSTSRQDKTISNATMSFSRVDKSVLDGSSVPSQTIIFENTNFKAAGSVTVGAEYKAKFGNELPKPQRQNRDRKTHSPDNNLSNRDDLEKREKPEPIELPLSFSKADENAADMKLDFTFDQELAELSSEKSSRPSVSLPRSSLALTSPASPSTHDLNLKIASVKKVWDTMTPLPEHPEDPVSSSSFSTANFSGVDKVSTLDHAVALESSFSSKEPVGVEEPSSDVGYQTGSPMQQGSGMVAAAAAAVAMVYTSSAASLSKAEVSRSGNVCKVKPQQQTACNNASISPGLSGNSISPPLPSVGHSSSSMYLGGTPAFGGIGGAIPSPPTVMFNSSQQLPQTGLFQPLFDGTTVLGQRGASQFSQYPYGIGQSLGSNAFGQQSMFLQTPPPLSAPADPYSNSLSQYRLQPNAVAGFGQSQPQPQSQNAGTVLISSASTTLMSSAVKPSTHTFGSSQQNFGTIGSKAGTPFQQSALGGALQGGALQGGALQGSALQGGPQPSVYIFDPSHSMSLLNSQIVQRPGVQSSVIQAIQTPSSFYSNNGAGAPGGPPTAPPGGPTGPQQAAAGYYTTSGSPLQAAVQQQAQPTLQNPQTFGLQGFGSQSGPGTVGVQNFGSGINLTTQQIVAQTFRSNPANFLKSLQPGCTMPDVTRQQIKSPSSAHNSFASTYFPNHADFIFAASSGTTLNHCSGNTSSNNQNGSMGGNGGGTSNMNLNSGLGHSTGGNVQNPNQMSSPKSQNRKMGGPSMNTSNQRTGGYNPQVPGQMTSNGALRTNMVIGMRNQLSMGGQNGLVGGPMTSGPPPPRYTCPGPIQRPSQNAAVSIASVATSNPVHRPVRAHLHQQPPSAGLHPAAATAQQRSANPSTAQQAKLRADALSTTQAFFMRDGTKPDKKLDEKVPCSSSTDNGPKDASGPEALSASPSSQADLVK